MYSSVGIDEDCSMRFRVHGGGVVDFWAGGDGEDFTMSFGVGALRRFVDLAVRAVAEDDALRAREQADEGGDVVQVCVA
ncbi:MAG TPA: hypothetical protein VGP26_04585 [Actinophytocola sp.]|nr:hypothetical protein [Actinophytocola sp.]